MSKTLHARLTVDHNNREVLVSVTVLRPDTPTQTFEVAVIGEHPWPEEDHALCATLDRALVTYANAFGRECVHHMGGVPCTHPRYSFGVVC